MISVAVILAACGGEDAVALEDWVVEVDGICADADEAADALEVVTPDDLADRGDEALAIAEGAVADAEALERPGGDEAPTADALLDGLATIADAIQATFEEVGDGEDELALLAIALDYEDEFADGAEAGEAVGSEDCTAALEDRRDGIRQIEELLDEAGELAEVRVGDCLTGLDTDLEPEFCGAGGRDGRVRSTIVTPQARGCEDGSELFSEAGISFCVEEFDPSPREDGLLELGSCITVEDSAVEGSVDVTEVLCSDPAATHIIGKQAPESVPCDPDEERLVKSDAELEDSGPGVWCAEPYRGNP